MVHFNLGVGDVVVMVVLFGLTIAKSIWVSWQANRAEKDGAVQSDSFFLAGRSMPWWAVGLSIFASNIGTEHFVGQAGAAAEGGVSVAMYEWSAGLLIFFLGFGLAPMYLGLDLTTMPQWFERRFNTECRILLAAVSMVAYVVTKIAASLFAGALLFDVMLGISMWTSVPVILMITALYAASGGLKAVMYTDVGQASIFIVGGVVGTIFAFNQIGGLFGLLETFEKNELGSLTKTIRSPADEQFPWTGMLVGQPLCSCWYWCVDQTMVQRVLSAKGVPHARKGCLLAGYLKILPPILMVFPGMIARAFYEECQRTDGDLYGNWCHTKLDDGNESSKAYPYLIAKTFPDGLRGLLVVSMVLAMMSSLDSVFNCVSTIFTHDIFLRFLQPGASPRRQILLGRLVTCVTACCGLAWLPIIAASAKGLYLTTQNAQTHMSPCLVAVFLVGLFWPRANGTGALAGMLVGFATGLTRFILNAMAGDQCEPWSALQARSITCMNFNHMGLLLFVLTALVTVVVSLLTKAPEAKQLDGTTWWSRPSTSQAASRCEVMLGGTLLTVLVGLVLAFGSETVSGAVLAPLGMSVVIAIFASVLSLRVCFDTSRRKASESAFTGLQGELPMQEEKPPQSKDPVGQA